MSKTTTSFVGLAALVAALLLAACSDPAPAAPPAGGGGLVQSQARAPAAPAPRPTASPPPAQPAVPTAPPTPAWTRSGKAPTLAMVKQALKAEGKPGATVLGKPLAVGDGRFVAAVHDGGGSVELLVLSESGGAAQVEGRAGVKLEGYWDGEGVLPSIAAWEAGDLDADGEPEAWAVVRYDTEPEPAVGNATVGLYVVLDLDPYARVAFQLKTQNLPQASTALELRTTVKYADASGDGHPDINVRAKECSDQQQGDDWKRVCETSHAVYNWDQSSDAWVGDAR